MEILIYKEVTSHIPKKSCQFFVKFYILFNDNFPLDKYFSMQNYFQFSIYNLIVQFLNNNLLFFESLKTKDKLHSQWPLYRSSTPI
jgi:hypothetical protein